MVNTSDSSFPFKLSDWQIAYQAALLQFRASGLVGLKLAVAVAVCKIRLSILKDAVKEQDSVSIALNDLLVLRGLQHTQKQRNASRMRATQKGAAHSRAAR